jgi:hypothetical protein
MKIIVSPLFVIILLCTAGSPISFAQTREETSLWDAVKDSKDPEDYKAYLDKYPDGVYAPLANRRAAEFAAHTKGASSIPAAKQGDTRAPPEKAIPIAPVSLNITECEGDNVCGTWTFLGLLGDGQWPSGEAANLSVQHVATDSVVIHRADWKGPSAGLTAVYRGTRHGDRLVGNFTATLPGQKDSVTGDWHATIGKAPLDLPMLMHMCIQCESGTGATLVWDKGHYKNVAALPGESETFTVESFTRESVILRRVDFGLHQGEAVLTGRISADGSRILDGVQRWVGDSRNDHEFHAAWGDAIGSVPGSRGPDPAAAARAVVCVPWFSAMSCQ